jgi:hypothetical protein
MERLGHYWYAAVDSGFANEQDWRAWADRRIQDSDRPEFWIIEMSLASTVDQLMPSLDERLNFERELNEWYTINTGDACLGFLYWSYKLGRLTLCEFLLKAGRMADDGNGSLIQPEGPYMILIELRKRMICGTSIDDLILQTDKLFERCWQIAKSQWRSLGIEEPSE